MFIRVSLRRGCSRRREPFLRKLLALYLERKSNLVGEGRLK